MVSHTKYTRGHLMEINFLRLLLEGEVENMVNNLKVETFGHYQ